MNIKLLKSFLFLLLLSIFTVSEAKVPYTLSDLYTKRLIPTKGMRAMTWLKDGERYSCFEQNKTTGGMDVVAYRAKDNKREVLIPSSALINPHTNKPLMVEQISWSTDNEKALIYTNSKRVWRRNTRGDYWVLTLKTGALKQLGKSCPISSLMFAKFSPSGDRVAYVSENNLYVENIADENVITLTTDGSQTVVNGTFDWVYEEEFGCRDGFRWSPDGQTIAYWQSDTEGTGVFDIIDNVSTLYPTIHHFPYPKAGTQNSAVKVGYVSATGGQTTWIKLPGEPRNNYIPRMNFIPESNELFIQQLNRAQNTNKVWIAKTDGSAPFSILTEKDAAWVETNDHIQWFDKNQYFTWVSERSGWRHLYKVSRDGKQMEAITSGDYDYISSVGMDKEKGWIYYIATPQNYTERYLYRTSLKKGHKTERVSPKEEKGQHQYKMSPTAKWAVHYFSNSETPTVIDMVSFPKGKSIRMIEDNKEALAAYKALGLKPKEFFKVKSGDLMLDAYMIKPIDFDSTKKYPVIIEVYGEPAASTVQNSWSGGSLWPQYMVNEGYLYVSIDNRGTKVPRGREWRKCIYGEVGTLASLDQYRASKEMAHRFSFIDADRIGITGWSGGGSQTLNCMFRYADWFKTGIAVAAVSDQRLYDTIYQERYMNTPQNNPEGYKKGSPITYASGLKGNLLVIHGTGDDNVHYQCTERLINELVKYGKIFHLMSYPMRTHGIFEGEGTSLHLRKTMEDFWLRNLPAGGK